MSKPRPVFKKVSIMMTRRVRGRMFLLRPSEKTNQIVRYVVAVMALRWKIDLHAIIVLGNHWHVCFTDPEGNVVDFQRDCHSFITRGVNAAHKGDFESMWSSEQTNRVECEGPDDLISRIAYTMANPVEAGLVAHGESWPGVRHAWPCEPMTIAKPPKFFRGKDQGGEWPDTVVLEFKRPPGYDHLTDDELATVIGDAIEQREEKYRTAYEAVGHRFLGAEAILAQSRYARPSSDEPRFEISPQVACQDKERRIERLASNRLWRIEHEEARLRWVAGERDVVFPHGTYQMRVQHGAACAPAAPT